MAADRFVVIVDDAPIASPGPDWVSPAEWVDAELDRLTEEAFEAARDDYPTEAETALRARIAAEIDRVVRPLLDAQVAGLVAAAAGQIH